MGEQRSHLRISKTLIIYYVFSEFSNKKDFSQLIDVLENLQLPTDDQTEPNEINSDLDGVQGSQSTAADINTLFPSDENSLKTTGQAEQFTKNKRGWEEIQRSWRSYFPKRAWDVVRNYWRMPRLRAAYKNYISKRNNEELVDVPVQPDNDHDQWMIDEVGYKVDNDNKIIPEAFSGDTSISKQKWQGGYISTTDDPEKRGWEDVRLFTPGLAAKRGQQESEIFANTHPVKRGWEDVRFLSNGRLGKRGWEDVHFFNREPFGKRGWEDVNFFTNARLGKRGWEDVRFLNNRRIGKRGWEDVNFFNNGRLGKRGWEDIHFFNDRRYGKRGWEDVRLFTNAYLRNGRWNFRGKRGWEDVNLFGNGPFGKRGLEDVRWFQRRQRPDLERRGWEDVNLFTSGRLGKRGWEDKRLLQGCWCCGDKPSPACCASCTLPSSS